MSAINETSPHRARSTSQLPRSTRVYCAVAQPPEGGLPVTAITTVHIEDYEVAFAEVERLREERDAASNGRKGADVAVLALEAERDRLRAFVEQVAAMGGANPFREDARAALDGGDR